MKLMAEWTVLQVQYSSDRLPVLASDIVFYSHVSTYGGGLRAENVTAYNHWAGSICVERNKSITTTPLVGRRCRAAGCCTQADITILQTYSCAGASYLETLQNDINTQKATSILSQCFSCHNKPKDARTIKQHKPMTRCKTTSSEDTVYSVGSAPLVMFWCITQ